MTIAVRAFPLWRTCIWRGQSSNTSYLLHGAVVLSTLSLSKLIMFLEAGLDISQFSLLHCKRCPEALQFWEFEGPPPQILLIHLGNNVFSLLKGKALVIQVTDDFWFILSRWPGILIIWSAVVLRCTWCATLDVLQADHAWQNTNKEIRNALLNGLGKYLMHPEIQAEEL